MFGNMIGDAQVWMPLFEMKLLYEPHCCQAIAALRRKIYSFRFRLRRPSRRVACVRLLSVSRISVR